MKAWFVPPIVIPAEFTLLGILYVASRAFL